MGRSPKRASRGSRILEQRRRTEGVEGRPSGCREFHTATGRPQRPPLARKQPRSMSHSHRHDLTVANYDGRTTTIMVPTRHEQHHYQGPLHQVSGQRLGRQAQSTPRQRRLETRPGIVCRTRHEVRKTFVRPLRLGPQRPPTPLQRRLEGPHVRGIGRPPPPRQRLAQGNQLVQPTLAPPIQPRPKPSTERRNSYRSPPSLDMKGLAPSAYRDGFRGNYHRSTSRLVPTRAAGATRYTRQSTLANDNIPRSLPAWLYLRRGADSATLALFTGIHSEPRIPHPSPAVKHSLSIGLPSQPPPTRGSRR
jgi:hypothetical protein